MATVRDLRKWLDEMGEDYTVYTDDKGDLCVDNAGCRHAAYRFYPEGDDTSDPSWYWRNVMAKRANVISRGGA